MNPHPLIEPIVDLSDNKTFIIATVLVLLFGAMIGIGFGMILEEIPNVSAVVKFQVFLVCVLTGSAIGFLPHIMRVLWSNYVSEDDGEDDEEGE